MRAQGGASLVIGVEAGLIRGPRTGVVNYTIHMVRALLARDLPPQFAALGGGRWSALDLQGLDELVGDADGIASTPRPATVRIEAALRHRLARFSPLRAAYRALRRRRFRNAALPARLDLFHAFNFMPPVSLSVPVVPVIHDLSVVRYPEFHPADRVRLLRGLADVAARAPAIQTVSEFSKREIEAILGIAGNKIVVAPPAAAAIFRPLGEAACTTHLAARDLRFGRYVLVVGTLEPRKNLCTLVDAFSRLPAPTRARCPMVVVGMTGWGDLALPAATERLRASGHLRFLGAVTNRELRSLYEGARLLIMPSIYEGFGMPVVEALACGTAVAHSSDTAMDEITAGLGRRAAALDVEGWTHVLDEAANGDAHADPLLREQRLLRARSFSWQASADRVAELYRSLS
ncbi:glycosyltransferase family 4 protein [Bradyrhizobium sp. HKCCYLR20261]|uniref:glycosyltransferase family 4 protein n=1 Tax=Bradyrhizobium sp. HKCCYLR20261 TaxID=3420760 RepID=UPI003EBAAE16